MVYTLIAKTEGMAEAAIFILRKRIMQDSSLTEEQLQSEFIKLTTECFGWDEDMAKQWAIDLIHLFTS